MLMFDLSYDLQWRLVPVYRTVLKVARKKFTTEQNSGHCEIFVRTWIDQRVFLVARHFDKRDSARFAVES